MLPYMHLIILVFYNSKAIVDKLPSYAADNIKALQVQTHSLLKEQSSHPSELMNIMERDHLHQSSGGSAEDMIWSVINQEV